jgi:hypothetical protein
LRVIDEVLAISALLGHFPNALSMARCRAAGTAARVYRFVVDS